jgi:hypothetical protein
MAFSPEPPPGRERGQGLGNRLVAARELMALGTMQFLQMAMAQSMSLQSHGLVIHLPAIRRLHYLFIQEIFPAAVTMILLLYLLALVWMLIRGQAPRRLLDGIGALLLLRLIPVLIVLNVLLFSSNAEPGVLLIQILLWTVNFAVGWGWFTWRLDAFARKRGKPGWFRFDGLEARSSFDYYYHSFDVVLQRRNSTMTSASRRGRLLIALHNLVLLNVLGITIARALQLALKKAG